MPNNIIDYLKALFPAGGIGIQNAKIEFSTILEYKTAKNPGVKYEDKGTALVQERMSIREREMVAELVSVSVRWKQPQIAKEK